MRCAIRRLVFQRDLCPNSCVFYGLMTWSNLFLLLCKWDAVTVPSGCEDNGCGGFCELVSAKAGLLGPWRVFAQSSSSSSPWPTQWKFSGELLASRKASSLSKGLSFPQMGGCAGPKFFCPFGQFDWAEISELFLTKHHLPTVRQK